MKRKSLSLFVAWMLLCSLVGYGQGERPIIVDSICVEGNKITKTSVILRELTFLVGDTLYAPSAVMNNCRENLLNTKLFHTVQVESIQDVSGTNHYHVNIAVVERWYFWVFPLLEMADRNFNEWWKSKDFRRLDYGLFFKYENFRGVNQELNFKAFYGYNRYAHMRYFIPALDKKKRFGLKFEVGHIHAHETAIDVINDKLCYYAGSSPVYQRNTFSSTLSYRNKIKRRHGLTLSYDDFRYADTIRLMNPRFMSGSTASTRFFSMKYEYRDDQRDYVVYPLKGYYFEANVDKYGLFGIDPLHVDFWMFKLQWANYIPIQDRWGFSTTTKLMYSTSENQPFFINKGLGYKEDYVRSYEPNVIRAKGYWIMRNNMKYCLINNQQVKVEAIPWGQFNSLFFSIYMNLFLDMGYAQGFSYEKDIDSGNKLLNEFLCGKGVGVDFVTYYNMVFRLEYSHNHHYGGGFFLHFKAAI